MLKKLDTPATNNHKSQYKTLYKHCTKEVSIKKNFRQGKARQVYLYSTFHTQWQFKVLYIEEI